MKKLLILTILSTFIFIFSAKSISAQYMPMMGYSTDSTASQSSDTDVVEGKAIFDNLQKKEVTCNNLKKEDFDKLGDYYMDQMMGSGHEIMDQRIENAYGADGLENMHIAMGERFSGCNSNAEIPYGIMNWQNFQDKGGVNNMMGWGYGMNWGGFGAFSVFALLFWILISINLILLAFYLWKQIKKK